MTGPHTIRGNNGTDFRRPGETAGAVPAQQPQDPGGHPGSENSCECGAGVHAQDTFLPVIAKAAFHQVVANTGEQNIVRRIDTRQRVDGVLGIQQGGAEAHHYHDGGREQLDFEGGAGVFTGVKHTPVQERDGECRGA